MRRAPPPGGGDDGDLRRAPPPDNVARAERAEPAERPAPPPEEGEIDPADYAMLNPPKPSNIAMPELPPDDGDDTGARLETALLDKGGGADY